MNVEVGPSFQFVAWSRRGVGADPPAPGPNAPPDSPRRLVQPTIKVHADRTGEPPVDVDVGSAPLAVLGPGDVVGIDPAQVVRRSPRPDDHQFEPNYLAAIEFAHPDLPWMFSPEAATSPNRSQPWLMLVVICVEPGQIEGRIAVRPGSPNPVLEIDQPGAIPPPGDAWAWAHIQVQRSTRDDALGLLAGESPDWSAVRSRVISPTHLDPDRGYVACLVPAYEAGRRAGLGLTLEGVGAGPWTPSAGLLLPVYDSWRFRTGPAGDFETLARKLTPIDSATLKTLGQRRVAIEPVASLMQRADAPEQLFPPAVQPVDTAIGKADLPGPLTPGATADPQAVGLQARLKVLVDIVAGNVAAAEPIVGPPLYGQWHAAVNSIDGQPGVPGLKPPPAGTAQTWVEELNGDPFLRMAAGIATRVVRNDQEELMADAWTQLDAVLAANRRVRSAQLFASAAVRLHARLTAVPQAKALRLANPALGRLRVSEGITVRAAIERTNLPRSVLSPTFARVSRYAAARMTAATPRAATDTVGVAIEGFRSGAREMLPMRFTTPREIDPGALTGLLGRADLTERVRAAAGVDPQEYVARLEDSPGIVSRVASQFHVEPLPPGGGPTGGAVRVRVDPGSQAGQRIQQTVLLAQQHVESGTIQLSVSTQNELRTFNAAGVHGALSPSTVAILNDVIATQPDLEALRPIDLAAGGTVIAVTPEAGTPLRSLMVTAGATQVDASVLAMTEELRSVARSTLGIATVPVADLVASLGAPDQAAIRTEVDAISAIVAPRDPASAVPPIVPFAIDTATQALRALTPMPAYTQMLNYAHRITPQMATLVRQRTPFHPVMAAPQFPRPMVERLRAVDQEWVLGGVGRLPANSICLLAVNWRFVEAFLVGANHEIARELLWRGYPTDLRGSCFRRFWPSVNPITGAPVDDIVPVDGWQGSIGTHSPAPQELTMVVIKGDLLRRYPSTIVTAELGRTSAVVGGTAFTNDGPVAHEVFRGFLDPDVSYVALGIPIATLRERPTMAAANVPDPDPRHGWYLSLRQPLDEPRFGLDDVTAANPGDNRVTTDLDWTNADSWSWQGLPAPLQRHLAPEGVFANQSSARVAAGLFQKPFRLLLRAADYLPDAGADHA